MAGKVYAKKDKIKTRDGEDAKDFAASEENEDTSRRNADVEELRTLSEILESLRDPRTARKLGHCMVLSTTCFSFGLGLVTQQLIKKGFDGTEWEAVFKGGFQVSLPLVVNALGSSVMMFSPAFVSLRTYLLIGGVGSVVVSLLNAFLYDPHLFVAYKVAIGVLGASVPSVVGPYIDSIAPLGLRTLVLGSLSFCIYAGVILGFLLNAVTPTSPLLHLGAGIVIMLIQLAFTSFNTLIPYVKNYVSLGEDIDDTKVPFSGIQALVREYIWFGLFVVSVLFSNFLQQFSGVTFALMEITTCLEGHIGDNPRLINFITGVFHLIGLLVQVWATAAASRIGRVRTLKISMGVVTVGNLITYGSSSISMNGSTVFIGLFVFIMGYNIGLAFVPPMLPYQYFNRHSKCIAVSRLAGGFNGFMGFLSTYFGVNYTGWARKNDVAETNVFGIFALTMFVGLILTTLFCSDESGLQAGTNLPNPGNNTCFMRFVTHVRGKRCYTRVVFPK